MMQMHNIFLLDNAYANEPFYGEALNLLRASNHVGLLVDI
jgi:hypothetical protein